MKKRYAILPLTILFLALSGAKLISRSDMSSPILEQPLRLIEKAGKSASIRVRAVKATTKEYESKYWQNFPNSAESFGVNILETEARAFLNTSQSLLSKAIKSSEDRDALNSLSEDSQVHETIRKHYQNLPEKMYFVEEATRVKMLNLLISNLESKQKAQPETWRTIQEIMLIKLRTIPDNALAKSIAGDQLRLLAAVNKYSKDQYQELVEGLTSNEPNKVVQYFENSLADNAM